MIRTEGMPGSTLRRRKLRTLGAIGKHLRDEALALGNSLDLDGDALDRALDPLEARRDVGGRHRRRGAAVLQAPSPCAHERKEYRARHAEHDGDDHHVLRHGAPPFDSVAVSSTGKIRRISVPDPRMLSASTRPPCASTVCFTIARPSPVPPVLSVTYGSKIELIRSGAMPTPVSRTAITISRPPRAGRADTCAVIAPLAPQASTALRSTLEIARLSAS